MKVDFYTDNAVPKNVASIYTNPKDQDTADKIKKLLREAEKKVILTDVATTQQVPTRISKIVYIEAAGRNCHVHLTNRKGMWLNLRLKQVEADSLFPHFTRINRRIIVNMAHVVAFRSASNYRIELTMSDHSIFYVSRAYRTEFIRHELQ